MGVMDGVALLSGCDPREPLAFSLLAALSFLMTEKRAELLQRSLEHIISQREQLARARGELRVLHERAFEQEKFSSLGMMAAGVAHEINNPMAFVTSNVNLLFKDLKQQPALPEPLKEYVDEVGRVVGRSQQLVQVLVNMLVNAGQATAPGGVVRLSSHREGEAGVRVEVRDTGMGMTPEVRRNECQRT